MSNNTDILLETGTNELEIIEFFIDEAVGGERAERQFYGVNVAKVLEVVEAPKDLERSEGATHPSFLGTIPLRDLILPVVDLSIWLDIERQESAIESIVVTEFNNTVSGFLVSGVTQIHRVNWKDVEPPSKYVASMPTNCITGTVKLEDRFTLILDLEQVLSDLTGEDIVGLEEDTPQAQENFRLLLADDSTSVREALREKFTRANFDVEAVGDGEAAWRKLLGIKTLCAEEGKRPLDYLDAVVTDVEMPKMDGYTLTRQIKEDPLLNELPVTLFSSLISKGVEHKGEAVKADVQVTKPEFHALVEKVIALVESWER